MPLTLEIITPSKKAYTDKVDSVLIPSAAGHVEILPGHIPLIGVLEMGEIIITKSKQKEDIMVDIGYFEVRGDTVKILTEGAIDVNSIDPQEVKDALARAEQAREEAKDAPEFDAEELERLEGMVKFLQAQRKQKAG